MSLTKFLQMAMRSHVAPLLTSATVITLLASCGSNSSPTASTLTGVEAGVDSTPVSATVLAESFGCVAASGSATSFTTSLPANTAAGDVKLIVAADTFAATSILLGGATFVPYSLDPLGNGQTAYIADSNSQLVDLAGVTSFEVVGAEVATDLCLDVADLGNPSAIGMAADLIANLYQNDPDQITLSDIGIQVAARQNEEMGIADPFSPENLAATANGLLPGTSNDVDPANLTVGLTLTDFDLAMPMGAPLTLADTGVLVANRVLLAFGDPVTPENILLQANSLLPGIDQDLDSVAGIIDIPVEEPSVGIVQQDTGATPADINDTIAAFEADLGGENNGGEPVGEPDGFRSINWDAVPDDVAAPAAFAGDFFNFNAAPRARGAVFTEPDEMVPSNEFQISADSDNPTSTAIEFGNLNPTYPDLFTTRSPERLFAYTDDEGTSFDVIFFVPGTTTPAVVSGFGAVFTDVDNAGETQIEYFDANGLLIDSQTVPAGAGDESLSFLGVSFPGAPSVARVRITSGSSPIGLLEDDGVVGDVVVMDDFIYGEPQPIEPPVGLIQQDTGATPADINDTIAAFEADLGGENNGGEPVGEPDGFRSINWDAVPDDVAAPAAFAGDFFNFNAAPRARGAVFTEPDEMVPSNEFQISADSDNPTSTAIEFGNLNPTYPNLFTTRSPERLFAYTDDEGTSFDVIFFVPGTTNIPAVVSGFGAVFTDVDNSGETQIEYFDANGMMITSVPVPAGSGDESLSFLGVSFPDGSPVARVRITAGSSPIGLLEDDGVVGDVVVMDDFIYSEPQPSGQPPVEPTFPFDELVDGDLSDDQANPTGVFILGEGDNQITAAQQGDPRDLDYFTFTVPDGFELSSIELEAYEAEGGNLAFLGLQVGDTFTVDPFAPAADDLLGGITYGANEVGTDILTEIGSLPGAIGFTGSLPADNYTIWLNQTGPISEVTLNFGITPAAPAGNATDIVISEVQYSLDAEGDFIELQNTGSSVVDISTWQFCLEVGVYPALADLTILSGNADLILEPGEIIVFAIGQDLDDTAADLGLYISGPFADPANIVDFVKWGSADQGNGRADVAVAAGIWTEVEAGVFDFVPTAPAGDSLNFDGENGGASDLESLSTDFFNGPPTSGAAVDLANVFQTTAELSPDNEIPPVAVPSNASGTAVVTLYEGTLTVAGTYQDLSSMLMDIADFGPAHLHLAGSEPFDQSTGPVAYVLTPEPGSDPLSGTFGGSFSLEDTVLDSELVPADITQAFLNGEYYFNIHTMNNASGELRAQVEFE